MPVACVCDCRSEPARSTRLSSAIRTAPDASDLSRDSITNRKSECDRELSEFILVSPTERFAMPLEMSSVACAAFAMTGSVTPPTKHPPFALVHNFREPFLGVRRSVMFSL